MVGYYSQHGIPTLLTSATTGAGIDRLRRLLPGRETVFSGQSGVGKSSLLNAFQPGLGLHHRGNRLQIQALRRRALQSEFGKFNLQ